MISFSTYHHWFPIIFYIVQNAIQAKRSQDVVIQEYIPEEAAGNIDQPAVPTGATQGELPGYDDAEDLTQVEESQHALQLGAGGDGGGGGDKAVIA